MTDHRIVNREEWVAARRRLLAKEKGLQHLRDELSAERRNLPWERVEKPYVFEGPAGRETLANLFGAHSQLVVYHFMFAPEWDVGCRSCSFWADNFNGIVPHLAGRDVSFAAVSRAPFGKLQAFAARMGWTFQWVSSANTDFNYDYQASFHAEDMERGRAVHNYEPFTEKTTDKPGVSVFFKDESGGIFHTYSTYARGIEPLNVAYQLIDLAPKGRDEDRLPHPMSWVRFHDSYGA